ncbi:MAG: glycogen/starch synthase [Prevotellaceae bacterium]|jgi:starch synthase|nr:glycogen/starch synthase [Prevotellaceae bacterium]
MEPTRILFICTEIAPYLTDTGMSEVGRILPQAIAEKGREIRVFMPRFGSVNERRNQLHEVIRLSGMNIIINDTDHPLIIKVASMPGVRTQVYFIDNDDFFQRKAALVDDDGMPFEDNDERAIFFARGVLETVKKLRWKPGVIHCQGWFTFLAALLSKKAYKDDPLFGKTKVVLAIAENEKFDQPMNKRLKEKLLIEGVRPKDVEDLVNPTFSNYAKFAIRYSDGVIFFGRKKNTTLDTFAKELKKPVLHCKKPLLCVDECNEFYTQVIRNK